MTAAFVVACIIVVVALLGGAIIGLLDWLEAFND